MKISNHLIPGHFLDQIHESSTDLDAGWIRLVSEHCLLLALQLPEGREDVALEVELHVAEDVGHDRARRGEPDLFVPIEIFQEFVERVGFELRFQIVIEIRAELVKVLLEDGVEVGVTERQVRVQVQEVHEIIAGMAVVDELVIDDDHVPRMSLIIMIKQDVVGPEVAVAEGVALGTRRVAEVEVQGPVGLDVEKPSTSGLEFLLCRLLPKLLQNAQNRLLGNVFELHVEDLGDLGLGPEPSQERGPWHRGLIAQFP